VDTGEVDDHVGEILTALAAAAATVVDVDVGGLAVRLARRLLIRLLKRRAAGVECRPRVCRGRRSCDDCYRQIRELHRAVKRAARHLRFQSYRTRGSCYRRLRSATMTERRQYRRAMGVVDSAEVTAHHKSVRFAVESLSAGGASLTGDLPLEVGDRIKLRLR